MALVIVLAVAALLALFLKTRLGLSIRATGDSPDMIKASSVNPAFTITVGLCVSGSLTALSGAVLAQYQKSCDINLGTGMVHHRPGFPDYRRNPGREGRHVPSGAGALSLAPACIGCLWLWHCG